MSTVAPFSLTATADPLIDIKTVESLAGIKKSAIYDRVRDGRMPAPVRLSTRCTRWRLSEITRWIAAQTGAA